MDVYGTEEEKIEAIKKWWNQNGKSIIAGIVIGITAIYGWRGYINYNVSQEKAASIIYEKLLLASRKNDTDNIRTLANSIITNYESSTYSVFSKYGFVKTSIYVLLPEIINDAVSFLIGPSIVSLDDISPIPPLD